MQRKRPVALSPWHGNQPLILSGRQSRYRHVASGVEQGRAYAALTQAFEGGIDRHTFRDPSEVELDSDGQRDLPVYRVDFDAAPAPPRLAGNDGIEIDRLEFIEGAVIADLHQLVQHGRIIDSFGGPGRCEGGCQDAIEQVAHGNGCACLLVEPGKLALRYETAQALLPLGKEVAHDL